MPYIIGTFVLSTILVWLVRRLMLWFGVVDVAKKETRKIHKRNIPLGGGLGIFLSMLFMGSLAFFVFGDLGNEISQKKLLGTLIGATILMLGGLLDDIYCFRPRYQLVFPVIATLTVMSFGIGLEGVTGFNGQLFRLDQWQFSLGAIGDVLVVADLLVFFWLMGMMYTTKILDGLDGLVAGVSGIGGLVIYFLATQPKFFQPEVALLASIFAAACFGFLVWNWHPAKVFLGEGGSLFTGYMLAVLAIISGSKIATTLLVIAVPAIDIVRVMIRRIQKKAPLFKADTEHLHFRLIQSGLNQKQAVLLFYVIACLFGMSTLFLQIQQKVIALLFILLLMILVGIWLIKKDNIQQ